MSIFPESQPSFRFLPRLVRFSADPNSTSSQNRGQGGVARGNSYLPLPALNAGTTSPMRQLTKLLSVSRQTLPLFSASPRCLYHTQLSKMSFETTSTIASFGGKLLKLKHKSSSTNTDMALNLFMPSQASKSGAKVPVLFYLSGLTCTGDNCSEKGFFQHAASKHGIAVVYPDTSPRKYASRRAHT